MATDLSVPCRVHSGARQALIVFMAALLFNLPRWFEFAYEYKWEVGKMKTFSYKTYIWVKVYFIRARFDVKTPVSYA